MVVTLELPDDLATSLEQEAERAGVPLPELALRKLRRPAPKAEEVRTGADLIAYCEAEGVFGPWDWVEDSQAFARSLRAEAESRGRHTDGAVGQ